jgi:PAS domain S-box-containing protein
VRASRVRPFRHPARIESNGRDVDFAAVAANIPGAIYRCALDDDWTMAMISDEVERISGYPPSDFIGNRSRTFASIMHPDDRTEVDRQVKTAVREDRPFGLEYRLIRADGEVVWVLERGQLVAGPDDQAWLHGVIFDITERKRAEDVLRRREAEEARIAELEAARARIISAQDATRRQIERDLHDGAQQQLVTLAMTLRRTKAMLGADPNAAAALLDEAIGNLADATVELRELARGIHPAALTQCGLPAAVTGLSRRAPFPVDLRCSLAGRLPGAIEVAIYYVVAECLTNIARYSEATGATIRLSEESGHALVEVADNGVGGATPDAGSGIRGLVDRIEALDGSLEIRSEPGQGTRIQVKIPLASTTPS